MLGVNGFRQIAEFPVPWIYNIVSQMLHEVERAEGLRVRFKWAASVVQSKSFTDP